jgi:hypothetical protein
MPRLLADDLVIAPYGNRSAEPRYADRVKVASLRALEKRGRFVVEVGRTGRRSWAVSTPTRRTRGWKA